MLAKYTCCLLHVCKLSQCHQHSESHQFHPPPCHLSWLHDKQHSPSNVEDSGSCDKMVKVGQVAYKNFFFHGLLLIYYTPWLHPKSCFLLSGICICRLNARRWHQLCNDERIKGGFLKIVFKFIKLGSSPRSPCNDKPELRERTPEKPLTLFVFWAFDPTMTWQ